MVNSSLTVTVLRTVCEIFSRTEVESRHYRPLSILIVDPLAEEAQQYQCNLYTDEKYYMGYNFVADNTGLISFV